MAATELHSFRCKGDRWQAAQAAMAAQGRTMTDLLVAAVEGAAAEYEREHAKAKTRRRKAG